MMYSGTGYSQQPALLGPGGRQQQQPALLGPGGVQQRQTAVLGPGGIQQQQFAVLGPGGVQQQQPALLGPGGTQQLLGPGGVQVQTGAGVGCCGVGGGLAAGGAGCCTTTTDFGGALSYVGAGAGEYITETTYKYVGAGAGDLSFVTPKRTMLPCILAALALIALVALALCMGPSAATTSKQGTPGTKTCTFWGDPHVITFDGGRPSFYGEGEFWIVKHPDVEIQGRYAGTKYTLGLASTRTVVVSGNVVNGHKIEVEPLDADFGGEVRIDGQPVLRDFGTIGVGGATVTYDGNGELVDEATSRWAKKVVHIRLPKGIYMDVFRWSNYIDMRIRMSPLEGMDGSCGNFNGYASDDTTEAIFSRVGARVPVGENLFSRRVPVEFSKHMEEMMDKHCDDSTKDIARQKCEGELSQDASSELVKACIFDYCFGMNEHALQTAKTFASEDELKHAGLE